MINPFSVNVEEQKVIGIVDVPAMLGIPNEILDIGKYDPILRGDEIQCKDWNDDEVLNFLNTIPEDHDLFIPVGFMETIEKDPYQLYCDTDSVVGNSTFKYSDGRYNQYIDTTIEKLWDELTSIESELSNDKEIKDISELFLFTPTSYNLSMTENRIMKIIRHKVSKKLWKLSDYSKPDVFVIVTEDHSLVVGNNIGDLIPTTIRELIFPDKRIEKSSFQMPNGYQVNLKDTFIISLNTNPDIINEFELFDTIWLEEVTEEYEYVYDIEVEDNPVFFANNILVHNSDYLLIKVTFDKNEDHRKTVDYCQRMTLRMNEAYMAALDLYFYKIAGWHPDFNTMDFKSEVVAYRGFFCTKKFYALGKVWDEGKFLGKLETKKTGGQIRKADATKVTKEMLSDIYHLLTVDQSIDDEIVLYNKIFTEIKNKYVFKLKDSIKQMDFAYFTIPKKWSFGEKKNIPPAITGAKLYNRIIKDTFTVGDAVLVLPIKYNMPLMKKEFEKINNPNEFMLQNKELTSKVTVISLPPMSKLNDKDKDYIKQRFQELQITLDYDTIMNFNIDMKLAPFKNLFTTDISRKARSLVEG